MRILTILALLSLVPGALAAVPALVCDATPCVPFARVEQGLGSQAIGAHVLDTPAAWVAFWSAHAPQRAPPAVDLDATWLVALVMDARNCCTDLTIRTVHATPDAVVVTYDRPGGILQAFSQPYDIVAIDRDDAAPAPLVLVGPPLEGPLAGGL